RRTASYSASHLSARSTSVCLLAHTIYFFFFFSAPSTTEIYTLSLHDALPILPHYHDWDLLRSGIQQLLADGQMRPHEPAFEPDPSYYVSWDYCKGFADGITTTENPR